MKLLLNTQQAARDSTVDAPINVRRGIENADGWERTKWLSTAAWLLRLKTCTASASSAPQSLSILIDCVNSSHSQYHSVTVSWTSENKPDKMSEDVSSWATMQPVGRCRCLVQLLRTRGGRRNKAIALWRWRDGTGVTGPIEHLTSTSTGPRQWQVTCHYSRL